MFFASLVDNISNGVKIVDYIYLVRKLNCKYCENLTREFSVGCNDLPLRTGSLSFLLRVIFLRARERCVLARSYPMRRLIFC